MLEIIEQMFYNIFTKKTKRGNTYELRKNDIKDVEKNKG